MAHISRRLLRLTCQLSPGTPRARLLGAVAAASDSGKGGSNGAAAVATTEDVKLTGHYAELTGHCAEQARCAFLGQVRARCEQNHWAVATFAGGCFWGPQLVFDRIDGVVATSVGYTQGKLERPNYDKICSGRTGHTEAVQVYYDDAAVSYETLLAEFWRSIDPTVVNGQGNDFGTQYRTGIYFHTSEQQRAAEASKAEEQKKYVQRSIATEVVQATIYWPAEEEHQNYLVRGGRFGIAQSSSKGCKDPIRCYG